MIVKRRKEEERAKDEEALGEPGGDGRLRDGGSIEGGGVSQCSIAIIAMYSSTETSRQTCKLLECYKVMTPNVALSYTTQKCPW